ncbi:MAG: hypothetical protein H6585_07165 [Flavobacteriales bacterium]|nr:hypothetical protein [Flavobacteriales bacterium]MCB9448106.1 hypothetical protein [Flavobacteriales bacterium]
MLLLAAALFTGALANAQNNSPATPCKCCTAPHRSFDFWLGEWEVTNPQGKLAGHNRITMEQDSCVLAEHWTGNGGKFTGTSLNFFDEGDQQWHQTWTDNQGGSLLLAGRMINGSMVLDDKSSTGNTETYNRITWTPNSDGTVRQHWEKTEDGGKTWATLFDGTYKHP